MLAPYAQLMPELSAIYAHVINRTQLVYSTDAIFESMRVAWLPLENGGEGHTCVLFRIGSKLHYIDPNDFQSVGSVRPDHLKVDITLFLGRFSGTLTGRLKEMYGENWPYEEKVDVVASFSKTGARGGGRRSRRRGSPTGTSGRGGRSRRRPRSSRASAC